MKIIVRDSLFINMDMCGQTKWRIPEISHLYVKQTEKDPTFDIRSYNYQIMEPIYTGQTRLNAKPDYPKFRLSDS